MRRSIGRSCLTGCKIRIKRFSRTWTRLTKASSLAGKYNTPLVLRHIMKVLLALCTIRGRKSYSSKNVWTWACHSLRHDNMSSCLIHIIRCRTILIKRSQMSQMRIRRTYMLIIKRLGKGSSQSNRWREIMTLLKANFTQRLCPRNRELWVTSKSLRK